jgi:hypothetical protein
VICQPPTRPYLLATDLRTAEDVARWLHEIDDDDITGGDPMWLTISRLDARLDRERRQACRRASFVALPELARLQRKRKFAVKRLWDYAVQDIDSLRRGHVRQALAFRAVARQP